MWHMENSQNIHGKKKNNVSVCTYRCTYVFSTSTIVKQTIYEIFDGVCIV